jgi:hypothetical protein
VSAARAQAALRVVSAALIALALVLWATGCAFLQPRPYTTRMVTLTQGGCSASAEVVVLDRGSASLVWPEFRDMATATARCGEHLIVIDAGSGRQLGSFVAPPSPTMLVPAPPPSLGPGSTWFQASKRKKAVAAYRALMRRDLARLRVRTRRQLVAWAASVMAQVGNGTGVGLDPTGRPLVAAFDSAVGDLVSLGRSGVTLGDRKVVAVLGLDTLSDAAPRLAAGLGGACVAVTGFPPSPGLLRTWRSELRWQGARSVVLLTRATSGQLSAVASRCLDGE